MLFEHVWQIVLLLRVVQTAAPDLLSCSCLKFISIYMVVEVQYWRILSILHELLLAAVGDYCQSWSNKL